jgi:uncharacterized membrane protein YsdA (DUF1294 family)
MLNLLAQQYSFTTTQTTGAEEGMLAAIMAFLMAFLVIIIPLVVFTLYCMWKVFEKAGREGWKAIIPVYNGWVMAEIAGKPGWWGIVGYAGAIPFIGFIGTIAAFVLGILISIEVAKAFGKEPIFALLLIFLPIIGFAILAFDKSKYTQPAPAKA